MNFRLIVLSLICFTISCTKVELYSDEQYRDSPYVIGHGGLGFQSLNAPLPENSFLSITKALDFYGADGVEVDLQMTKDLQLVLYHDDVLESSTDGSGYTYEYNLEEVISFRYNLDFFVNLLVQEHVTSLEVVLAKISTKKIKPQLHLDLRSWLYDDSIYSASEYYTILASKIVELLNKYNYSSYTYVASGEVDLLKKIAEEDPSLKIMLESSDVIKAADVITNNGWFGCISNNTNFSKSDVEYFHSKSIQVALFEMKTQKTIEEAFDKNPDFLLTDNIVKTQQIIFD